MFAGTGKFLYEAQGTNWTSVSRASTYTPSASIRWRFAQFGNVSLASNEGDTIQASSSAAFADIAGAPAAGVIETVGQFVFAFNTTDGTYGISPDRWWCSAIGDNTLWTPSVATQATTGRLTATPGKILGAKSFGQQIVAYKQRSMYLGTYVGPPTAWDFQRIPGEAGAQSHEAIANIGTPENPKHIFMGYDDFYIFDGGRPTPIGSPVRQTVFTELLQSRAYTCMALHDRQKKRVYFFYPTSDSVMPDKCVVYNYQTNQWGRDDRQIQIAMEYVTPGMTYDQVGTTYSTYDSLPSTTYDTAFLSQALTVPGVFDSTGLLNTLTGAAGTSSITTGDFGDPVQVQTLQRVRPKFLTKPTTSSLVVSYAMSEGDTRTSDSSVSISSGGFFDVLRSARFFRLQITHTGDWEYGELFPILVEDGSE
jgi:hypothetical protein